MNISPGEPEKLLLKGISLLIRAKKLSTHDRAEAVRVMHEGVNIINKSIILSPDDIENRLMRARHLLEASMASTVSFLNIVEEDILYLKSRRESFDEIQLSLLYNIIGDYYIYLKNSEKGTMYYRKTISIDPDSTCGIYAKKMLEVL